VRGVVYYSINVTMDGYIDDSPCLRSCSPCGIESSVQFECCNMDIYCTTIERGIREGTDRRSSDSSSEDISKASICSLPSLEMIGSSSAQLSGVLFSMYV